MAKQLVLIHGSGNTSEGVWLPYLKTEFEKRNWKVVAPDFPGGDEPTLEGWLGHADSTIKLTTDTVLVGHSLGCPFIMSLLERSGVRISKAICVAGLYDKSRFEHDFLQEQYDWVKIKNNCEQFIFIHSTNDPWKCDEQEADLAFGNLGGTKIIMKDEGHFGTEAFNQPYPEFPFLVKLIED